MQTRSVLRICIVALGLTAASIGGFAGEQQTPAGSESPIKVGDFRDLDFWRRLKLATAYYVNPDLANRAEVLYIYPASKLADEIKIADFLNSARKGEVAIAIKTGSDKYKVVPLYQMLQGADLATADTATIKKLFDKADWQLVARRADLFGAQSDDAIVSWGPYQAKKAVP
jgi:hypothetical protein